MWKASLLTKAKTAEWDRILRSSQRLQVRVYGGLGDSANILMTRVALRSVCAPIEGYNHASHHDGVQRGTWPKAEQLDI